MDLSALAMLASITNFILHCFQLEETNGTELLQVEVDGKPHLSRYPVALTQNLRSFISLVGKRGPNFTCTYVRVLGGGANFLLKSFI